MSRPIKVYDETYSSVNIFTTPIDISGLDGDVYDYHVDVVSVNPSSSSNLLILPNADTSLTNYRQYYMRGQNATDSAFADDTYDSPIGHEFLISNTTPSFLMMSITGSSGDERSFSANYGSSGRVYKSYGYWKNTADNLTSLRFTASGTSTISTLRIIIYRTLKEASHDWELMEIKSFASNLSTTPISFSTVDGDLDLKYKVEVEYSVGSSADLRLRLNTDSTSNYEHQELKNVGGTISSVNATETSLLHMDSNHATPSNGVFIINAESGVKRLVTVSGSAQGSARDQHEAAYWWGNTADNITDIQISGNGSTTYTGTAKLYRQKKKSSDPWNLPFKVIEEVAVSGDFSAGHTFSNLLGDSTTLYKISGLFSTIGNDLQMQINSNTGSVYTHQTLKGVNSTASASTTTTTFALLCDASVSLVSSFDLYIYPQSGEVRPCLLRVGHGEDSVEFKAFWYTETATEITSIKVFASSTGTCTGDLTIQRLG